MQEKQQAKKILNELLNYFFWQNVEEIKMALDFTDLGFYIEIQGEINARPDDLERLAEGLNAPRDLNMEEYSEQLIGSEHYETADYHLLGLLVDDAEILYDAPHLDIKIFRKK